jgi:hypothetical protein
MLTVAGGLDIWKIVLHVQADLDIWLKAMAGGEVTAQEWRRYFTSKEIGATTLNESFFDICILRPYNDKVTVFYIVR